MAHRRGRGLCSSLLLAGGLVGGFCEAAEMSPAEIVVAANQALWNQKDISAIERYFAPTMEYQTPYATVPGREGLRADALQYYAWVEWSESTFHSVLEEGDEVAVRWESQSRPKGEVRTYNSRGIDLYRVEDGLITQLITAHEIDSTARNKAVVQALIDRLWNRRELDVVDAIFAPEAVIHITDFETGGPEKIKADAERFFTGWSDHETTIQHLVAEGDLVTIRWETTATHTGDYGGIPATGKTMTYYGMDIYRLADGVIVETWSFWDAFDVYSKLGVLSLSISGRSDP